MDQLVQTIKRLRIIGVINIALILVLLNLWVAAYFLLGASSARPDQDEKSLQTFVWLLPMMKYLNLACLGLLLLWGPALVVYLFRLKQMRKLHGAGTQKE